MKLTFTNFKCYSNYETVIEDGVTLIKGVSGAGKTSIFDAIDWVLFGKLQKPYSHGVKKCSVKLQFLKDAYIIRQGGPGKLTLAFGGKEYDGAVAQEVINGLFGSRSDFLAGSYLKQGERCPLLTGSNAEKMTLLNNISFKDEDVKIVMTKLKDASKIIQEEIQTLSTEFSGAKASLKIFKEEYEGISDIDLSTINIDEINNNITTCNEQIISLELKYSDIIKKEASLKIYKDINIVAVDISGIDERNIIIDSNISSLKEKLDKISSHKMQINASKQIITLRENKISNLNKIKKVIEDFYKNLSISEEKLESEIERLQNNKTHLDAIKTIQSKYNTEDIEKKLEELNIQIKKDTSDVVHIEMSVDDIAWNVEQNQNLICPTCSSSLQIKDSKLHLIAKDFKPIIKDVKFPNATQQQVNELKAKIQTNLKLSKDMKEDSKSVAEHRMKMGRSIPSDTQKLIDCINIKDKRNIVINLEKELKEIPEVVIENFDDNTDALNEELKTLTDEKISNMVLLTKNDENIKSIKILEELQENLGTENSDDIKKTIDNIKIKLTESEKSAKLYIKFSKFTVLKDDFEKLNQEFDQKTTKSQHIVQLISFARKVEIEMMDNTVKILNSELKEYFDVLFSDEPMTVEFKTIKNLKNKKTKRMTCSLVIFYKNNTYDNVRQLSGGEQDRVSLGMFLALNNLMGSNIMLLDESLAALDETLKINTVELLKKISGVSKRCMVIAHEGIEGVYDQVISV